MCSVQRRFVESWWGTSCSVFAESALSGCWHASISLWVPRLRLPRGRTQLWPELRNVRANVFNTDDDSVRLRTFDHLPATYHLQAVGLLSPASVAHIFWQTLKINWLHFESSFDRKLSRTVGQAATTIVSLMVYLPGDFTNKVFCCSVRYTPGVT